MFKVTIPTPCHEDWHQMKPTDKGANCGVCSKEVIDFTTMSDDEVKYYLLNRNPGKLCGRFRKQQVNSLLIYLPKDILSRQMAAWKKFITIVLLVFSVTLIGCDVIIEQANKLTSTTETNTILTGDTVITTMGILLPPMEKSPSELTEFSMETMGDISLVIADSITVAELNDNLPDCSPIMGKFSSEPVSKTLADTASANHKNPADTSDCGTQNYY